MEPTNEHKAKARVIAARFIKCGVNIEEQREKCADLISQALADATQPLPAVLVDCQRAIESETPLARQSAGRDAGLEIGRVLGLQEAVAWLEAESKKRREQSEGFHQDGNMETHGMRMLAADELEHASEQIKSRIGSAPQSSAWRPIEFAPKDGTHILFGRVLPWASASNVCVGFWADESITDFPQWRTDNGFLVDTNVYQLWQPLPTPPPETVDEKD